MKPATVWYTHVNRGVIDSNRKNKTDNPPVTFRKGKYGRSTRAFEVEFPAGSRMIYSPHEPVLPCGARLVVISPEAPKVIR